MVHLGTIFTGESSKLDVMMRSYKMKKHWPKCDKDVEWKQEDISVDEMRNKEGTRKEGSM